MGLTAKQKIKLMACVSISISMILFLSFELRNSLHPTLLGISYVTETIDRSQISCSILHEM